MRIVLASACLVLMACPATRPDVEPSNDGGPAVDAGVPAVDNLALAKTAVMDMCQFMYGCYGESRLMKAFATMGGGLVPSPEDCAEEVTEESEAVAHLAGGLESGRITVDWAAWDVCVESMECSSVFDGSARGLPCGDVVIGQVAEGDGCFSDPECQGAGVSHRCSASGSQCGTCILLSEEGVACEGDDDCRGGLTCAGEEDSPQVCTPVEPMLAAGAACNGEEGPLDGNCDMWKDLICLAEEGESEGTCTEASFDAQEGEFCFLFGGVFCVDGLVCPVTFMPDEDNPPTCRNPVEAGETCLEGEGFAFMMTPCVSGFYCHEESGTCAAQKPNGASCEEDGECAEGSCGDAGVCGARSLFGDDERGDYQQCP